MTRILILVEDDDDKAKAWKQLEAAFREETEAQNKYWSSFE